MIKKRGTKEVEKKNHFWINLLNLLLSIILLAIIFYFLVTQIMGEEFTQEGIKRSISIAKEAIGLQSEKVEIELVKNNQEEKNFYESQLDEYAGCIYTMLEENEDKLRTGTYCLEFGTAFNNVLQIGRGMEILNRNYQAAIDAFLLDHPEVFYLDIRKMYLIISSRTILGKTTYTVTIGPEEGGNYLAEEFNTPEKVERAIDEVEKKKKEIWEQAPENTYDKIAYIHDWIVENNEYDREVNKANIRNIYGALVEGEIVCEGYAKAFQYLIQEMGISCITVVGEAKQEEYSGVEAHAWNYIKLNEKWYGVDVTWDDPIVIGGKQNKVMKRRFFLRGNNVFGKRHSPTGEASEAGMPFSYPELSEGDF